MQVVYSAFKLEFENLNLALNHQQSVCGIFSPQFPHLFLSKLFRSLSSAMNSLFPVSLLSFILIKSSIPLLPVLVVTIHTVIAKVKVVEKSFWWSPKIDSMPISISGQSQRPKPILVTPLGFGFNVGV